MHNGLFDLFVEELSDMYSAENQIVEALPKMIKAVSFPDLKEALSNHLEETKEQVKRIEKIFSILGISPMEMPCEPMEALLKKGDDLIQEKPKSSILDAAIISAAQKVEHHEIASYGALKSFAKQLDLDDEILELLQANAHEEGEADKKLTKLAIGTFFTKGVNKEASSSGVKKRK